jgi:Domain of unknown function (DUF4118)
MMLSRLVRAANRRRAPDQSSEMILPLDKALLWFRNSVIEGEHATSPMTPLSCSHCSKIVEGPALAGRPPGLVIAEMTREIAGPNVRPLNPHERRRKSRALLVATVGNLSIIAALTSCVALIAGTVPSAAVLALYFIPVLLATLLWNFEQGMIAAFASAFAAEFFCFAPAFSFRIDHWRDVLALLIFLAAALLSGYLVDGIRRLRHAASAPAAQGDPAAESTLPDRPVLRFAGPTRTVPERIAEFLVGHERAMYCDQCIQDQLGLKWRQQVQLVTATLAVTNLFQRDSGQCQNCNQLKHVIRHVKPQ